MSFLLIIILEQLVILLYPAWLMSDVLMFMSLSNKVIIWWCFIQGLGFIRLLGFSNSAKVCADFSASKFPPAQITSCVFLFAAFIYWGEVWRLLIFIVTSLLAFAFCNQGKSFDHHRLIVSLASSFLYGGICYLMSTR